MWRHGIHSFLELLRHRLPDSFEHMLAFVYLAYSMMALLSETVPVFHDTWIEYVRSARVSCTQSAYAMPGRRPLANQNPLKKEGLLCKSVYGMTIYSFEYRTL